MTIAITFYRSRSRFREESRSPERTMMGARSRGRETTRVPAPLNRTQSAATVGRMSTGAQMIISTKI